jgi:hypothetical protein
MMLETIETTIVAPARNRLPPIEPPVAALTKVSWLPELLVVVESLTHWYCDVFGRNSSLIGNGKLNSLPWIHSALQQYQMDAWQPRMGDVRFEIFTAVTMKNGVFWDVTPCGSCKNRRFGGT